MIDSDVRSIPIVDGSTVVGIVSRRDLLRTITRDDDILTAEIQHRVDDYAGGIRRWQVAVNDGVVTISGAFHDDAEENVVKILATTLPGATAVHLHRTSQTDGIRPASKPLA
jgi:CBS domain-containing protein